MKGSSLILCVLCLVIVSSVSGKRISFSSRRSKPSSNTRHKTKQHGLPYPTQPPPKKTQVNTFLDSERQQNNRYSNIGQNQNPRPLGFDNVNQGTNNRPIGFEGFNEPNKKIGFDNVNKPSAPVMPGNYNPGQFQGQKNDLGQPLPNTNFGQSYPGQYPNSGQTFPNQHQNFGNYPANPNFGHSNPGQYPHSGQTFPNQQQNFGNYPGQYGQSNFGHNYPGQNNYPGSYFGNSNPGFGQGYNGFGNGYNNYHQGYGSPYGGNNFPGGGFGGGFFGSNNGFGYGNNYGKKSRFGLGGLPLPIPIPIPIPFGGFGGFGSGYNSYNSHRALNNIVQQASSDSNNATSLYLINNNTVLPCSREQFRYDSYNVSLTTCTVLNCTAVSMKTEKIVNGNTETNYGSVTMCLDPSATLTTNSSGSNLPRLSDTMTFMKAVCEYPASVNNSNILVNGINVTENKNIEQTKTEGIEENKPSENVKTVMTSENVTQSNLTNLLNVTDKTCSNFNCSEVEFCMPKAVIHCEKTECNYTLISYTSCIKLKMCNSQFSPIVDREVKFNTMQNIEQKDNQMTTNNLAENITVVAYVPPVYVPMNSTWSTNNTSPLHGHNASSSGEMIPSTSPL